MTSRHFPLLIQEGHILVGYHSHNNGLHIPYYLLRVCRTEPSWLSMGCIYPRSSPQKPKIFILYTTLWAHPVHYLYIVYTYTPFVLVHSIFYPACPHLKTITTQIESGSNEIGFSVDCGCPHVQTLNRDSLCTLCTYAVQST